MANGALGVRQQCDTPHYAVPIALRLVGDRVRILADANILDAVVHLDIDNVLTTIYQIRCNIVLMRYRQRRLMVYRLTVDNEGGFYMRTFHEQNDMASLPLLRNEHFTFIPCMTYVMAVRRQEKRKLQLASLAVTLHIRIEIE